ncbi:ferritin family protein [Halocatena pleomorpha]|uniref:Ribonucleoside-diphosphate reductase n=1 Tax=Halocatena pleomorpha TaxID=1785090 RepID=A0A3P3RJM2_9EURY|nr:ribonucleoside-diphosphate reductase [Halocatena pleomorpha]RRJ33118.1 ribonucleoside-diphosphate reductase [Halocatena pleomorpha]
MTQVQDETRTHRLDPSSFAGGYFRNAVYRHWDPYEDIPEELLEQDRQRLIAHEMTEPAFDGLRRTLALFGAGEESVTEDLTPLLIVTEDVNKQMFLTSQLYEEAKHTQFFDRYWRDVIDPVAKERGFEVTAPTDQRYFNDDYVALFEKTEQAMNRLLTEDSPTSRARAYCHYHLIVESVLAQTGYYGIQSSYSPTGADLQGGDPVHLEGLIEGITRVRSDEGRHVGFGMHEVQRLIAEDDVDPEIVRSTLQELLGHVVGSLDYGDSAGERPVDATPLIEYATEKTTRRIEIITDADADLPPVEELVHVEGGRDLSADT